VSLSIVDRLMGKAMKADPVQSCCGERISRCECNDLVCVGCGETRAVVEFMRYRKCDESGGIHSFVLRGK
jgi:hypothetical protein